MLATAAPQRSSQRFIALPPLAPYRADQVPALSCCSVETLMLELSRTSPGRQAVGRLNQRLAQVRPAGGCTTG